MPSTESELKRALGAFKKRIKMINLDDDSKLGRSPLTGNKREKVVAIQPPAGFGKAIWEELADMGFLKRDTVGFYEMTQKQWQNNTMAEHAAAVGPQNTAPQSAASGANPPASPPANS